jgi:hypothetical protein
MMDLLVQVSSVEDDLAEMDSKAWTVAPVDSARQCPLPALPVPTPPFSNVTREWHHTTGDWSGIRMFRDGVACCEAGFVERGRLWTRDGTLAIIINANLSIS